VRKYFFILSVVAALSGCAGGPANTELTVVSGNSPADLGSVSEVGAPRERARIHTELGAAYYEIGNIAVALEELRIAIGADSAYAPAYSVLGLVQMDLKENGQAQASFQRALQLAPNDPDANHNYAWFLCQTDREDQSLKYFLTAVRNPLYATPAKSYALAGVCAIRKNNHTDGIEYLERALRLDPGFLPAMINLAQVRYRRGEFEAARVLVSQFNRLIEPTAESLWLATRIERRLGDKNAETNFANQLRRRFAGSRESQDMQKGNYE